MRLLRIVAAALLLTLADARLSDSLACACCSERGSRTDQSVRLDDATRVQLERMVFAREVGKAIEAADDRPGPLPAGSSSSYELIMVRDRNVMRFALKDPQGRTGQLSFMIPATMWIFAVDPFGEAKDEGLGPLLYKEWRLTAPVRGDGIFRRGTPPGQKATLILHGRGRGCTEAEDFTDWSLRRHGPAGALTFHGALEKL